MIYRQLYYFFFISFALILQISGQNSNSNINSAATLISKANKLESDIDTILQKQDIFKNNPESISLISDSDLSIPSKDIFERLLQINQLKKEYFESIESQFKTSSPSDQKYVTIQQSVLANGKLKFEQCTSLLNSELSNENTDVPFVFEEVKSNQTVAITALKMAQDINDKNPVTINNLNNPIHIEEISTFYKIDPKQMIDLLSLNDETENALNKDNQKSEKIVKGYSPFSNEHKEFIIFADSMKRNEDKNILISNQKKKNNLTEKSVNSNSPFEASHANNQNNEVNNDSLFPHELLTRFDKESLKRYWEIYRNESSEITMANKQVDRINTGEMANEDYAKPHIEKAEENANKYINSSIKINEEIIDEELSGLTPTKNNHIKDTLEANQIPIYLADNIQDDDLVYYVIQVAASRTPISTDFLHSIYNGNDSLITRKEEGWYKYQYGKTRDYSKAKREVNHLNISGAFIVAYRHNDKQVLWKTLSPIKYSSSYNHLTFAIQLSANKKSISTEQKAELQKKAGGFVREIEEDNWFKYQYIVGSSYAEALKKWKEIGTEKSFMVAYYDNEKIEMIKAIQIYKRQKTN